MLPDGSIFDNKFQILEPLGMGGYGIVYRAKQLSMDRVVALKILHSQGGLSVETVKRFEREAKILSSLRNKHLVLFYAFGVANQSPYIAMELLDGRPLQSMLSEQPVFTAKRAIAITRQILEALSCAHANGIFHRDLKPSNVMVMGNDLHDEQIKIIDFGLAGIAETSSLKSQKLTETGGTVGTVEYMSPEQITGHEATARSDVYAAGCILYRCLCGISPFNADNNIALMQRHLYDDPKPLTDYGIDARIAHLVQPIIDTALAVQPEQRYQSAEEMLRDLERADAGKQSTFASAKIQPRAPRESPPKSRNFALIATTLGIAVLLATTMLALNRLPLTANNADLQRRGHVTSIDLYSQGHELYQHTAEFDTSGSVYRDPTIRKKISRLFNRALEMSKTDGLLNDKFKTDIFDYLAVANRTEAQNDLSRPSPPISVQVHARELLRLSKELSRRVIETKIRADQFDTALEAAVENYGTACQLLGDPDEASRNLKDVVKQWHAHRVTRPFYLETNLLDDYVQRKEYRLAVMQGKSFVDEMPASHEAYGNAVNDLQKAEAELRAQQEATKNQ